MKPYQKRVADEKKKLDEKLTKLEEFIDSPKFDEVDDEEKPMLRRQRNAMQKYSNALEQRVMHHAGESEPEPEPKPEEPETEGENPFAM